MTDSTRRRVPTRWSHGVRPSLVSLAVATALALAAAMASPVVASASTVSLRDLGGTKGFVLHYDAAADETNNVTISLVGTCGTFTTCELVIEDTGAAITRPGSCTTDFQSKVHCPASSVSGLDVKVLNRNDGVVINGSKPAVVHGGDGLDTLTGGDGGDSLDGGQHNDTLDGGAGDDTLADTGISSSPDTLRGGEGDDTLAGGAWPDTLDGGPGADDFLETNGGDTADYSSRSTGVTVTLDGNANDGGPEDESGGRRDNVETFNVAGGSGDDTLTGDDVDTYNNGSDDVPFPSGSWRNGLTGNGGADNLDGAGGPDKLVGGPGDDTLEGGAGDDPSLDGGPGADDLLDSSGGATADYSGRATPVNVTLDGAANDGSSEDQNAAGRRDDVRIDDVSGSSGGDTLIGGTGDNALTGNDGPDTLAGGGGTDTLYAFGEPDQFGTVDPDGDVDTLTGGEGGDILHGDGDGETLAGEGDADTLRGHGGNDTLNGGEGGDDLDGGFGNDIHNGGPGADSMLNDRGADDFIGGDGIDSTSYADYYDSQGVTVTLDGNPNDGGEGFFNGQSPYNQDWPYTAALADRRGDNVQTENVTGSSRQGDELTGDGNDNVLVGAGGQVGFSGDRITGGGGNDILSGGDRNDSLTGGEGNDSLSSGAGDDVLDGGTGAEDLDGGPGSDLVTYAGRTDPLEISLDGSANDGDASDDDGVRRDNVLAAERVVGGEAGDTIVGNAAANRFEGRGGGDTLLGGAHDDVLDGGAGEDRLEGGSSLDSLTGGPGDDALDGGASADQLVGGDGLDAASYATRSSAVAITLDDEANDGDESDEAHGLRDNVQTEDVVGGSGDDALTGSGVSNRLEGRLGDDILRGGSADDDLRGGDGRDELSGEDGGDVLDGGASSDVLSAGAGNDILRTLDGSPDQDGCGDDFDAVVADLIDTVAGDCEHVTRPALSIQDVRLTEGNSGTRDASFTVALSDPVEENVTVDYATQEGSAKASADYEASSGTLAFAPNEQTKTITVRVRGDTRDEPDETFGVRLTNVRGASIQDGDGRGTIVDDDPPPALRISDSRLVEGHTGIRSARFTVRLSAASGKTVAVRYGTQNGSARAPSDYTARSASLSFSPGQTAKTVTVAVRGDRRSEPAETFFVNLFRPANATVADRQGRGTILNDD